MATVEINRSQMASVENLLSDIKNGAKKAVMKSINQTVTTTKVQIRKKVGEELNLTAKRIGEDIVITKANYTSLSGKVVTGGEKIGLINFAKAQTKVGTKVKVKKSGTPTMMPQAFKAAVGGKQHLFWRKYHGSPKAINKKIIYGSLPKKYRSPVERLIGPSVSDAIIKSIAYNKPNTNMAKHLSRYMKWVRK